MKSNVTGPGGWRLLWLRYPSLFIALPLAAGISLAWKWEVSYWHSLIALVFAGLVAFLGRSLRSRLFTVLFLVGVIGVWRMALATALSEHDLRDIAANGPQIATIRGRLTERATTHILQRNGRERLRSSTRIAVEEIFLRNEWRHAIGTVAVSSPYLGDDAFTEGRQVEVAGVLSEPAGAMAPGLFDYKEWLAAQRIHYELRVAGTNDWMLLDSGGRRLLTDRFFIWARKTLALGISREDEALRLVWAMALGWKPGLGGTVSEPFMRTGTLHVFAISGFHIVLVAHLLQMFLQRVWLPKRTSVIVVLPVVWFYVAATGWQSSAVRAAIMSTVWMGGLVLKRPSNALNSLAASAILIFLWDPAQLFQAGFQLSFAAVLSLAVLSPALSKAGEFIFEGDPFLPEKLATRPVDYIKRLLRRMWVGTALTPTQAFDGSLVWGGKHTAGLAPLSPSLAALLGTAPIIAVTFHMFSPVSLVANIIIIPMSELVLGACMVSLAFGWLTPVAALLNNASWWLMKAMIWLCDYGASVPWGSFNLRNPGWILFILYYVMLAGIFSGWLFQPIKRRWVLGSTSALALLWLGLWMVEPRVDLKLTLLPGRAGPVYAEIEQPRSEWLFDCADQVEFDFTVKPFLRAQGINRLQNLVLTQGDKRRMGAVEELDELFRPSQLVVGGEKFLSPIFRTALEHFQAKVRPIRKVHAGDSLDGWEVLHPPKGVKSRRADDRSVVVAMERKGWRVMLLGELGAEGQAALLSGGGKLHADILVMGATDRGEALKPELLEAIDPSLIIQTGQRQAFSRKLSAASKRKLRATHRPVLFTDEEGAVEIEVRKRGPVIVRTSAGGETELHKKQTPAPEVAPEPGLLK